MHVVPLFALLAIAGGLSTLAYVGRWVYLSRGMAADLMRYTLVSFVLQLACILAGSSWGVVGVAWGYMIAAAVEWPMSLYWLSRRTILPMPQLVLGGARISACGCGAGLVALALGRWVPVHQPAISVSIAACGGAAWYAVCGLASRTVRADLRGVADFARQMVLRSRPS
jgi:PST family polysaccharide transporter